MPRGVYPRTPAVERFFSMTKVMPDGCWHWTGSVKPYGYGRISVDGVLHRAHRFAYETFVGPIPEGLTIDHLCRVKHCVNPAHMEVVTFGENTLRGGGVSGVNARKTHCPQGHPYDEANTRYGGGKRYCRTCRRERARARRALVLSERA